MPVKKDEKLSKLLCVLFVSHDLLCSVVPIISDCFSLILV